MNLFFKAYFTIFLFFFSTQALSRQAVLITYEHHKAYALLVKKILNRDVFLPEQLIKIRYQLKPCEKSEAAIVQICVKKSKEIEFAYFNQEVVQRSLSVFWEGKL